MNNKMLYKVSILFFIYFILVSFFTDWIKHPENIDYVGNLVGGLSGLVGLVIIMKFFTVNPKDEE